MKMFVYKNFTIVLHAEYDGYRHGYYYGAVASLPTVKNGHYTEMKRAISLAYDEVEGEYCRIIDGDLVSASELSEVGNVLVESLRAFMQPMPNSDDEQASPQPTALDGLTWETWPD